MNALHLSHAPMLAAAMFVGALIAGRTFAQEVRGAANVPAHEFLGVGGCERCHRSPTQDDIERGVVNFVRLTESVTWLNDVHSKAYEFIDPTKDELASQRLSDQICTTLKINSIAEAQQCLSCHSNWLKGQDRPPTYTRGVACESCHGPSSDWERYHRLEDWRAKPVAEKESLGMINVRDPVKRAEQCFSCHIGNVAEGKVITHEMYAAGHPPLPSIEIESFASQMPPHWRYLADKPEFNLRKEFIAANMPWLVAEGENVEQSLQSHKAGAAAVVLGGAIALRESLQLVHDLAAAGSGSWPELAAFDCAACHHDLKNPSWRQQRPGTAHPGRPILHEWPAALTSLALVHASAGRESFVAKRTNFSQRFDQLGQTLAATPFGTADAVRKDVVSLNKWMDSDLVRTLATKPFDAAAVRLSIAVLLRTGQTDTHDYNSARQIAWALRVMYENLDRRPAADAQIQAALNEIVNYMGLDLLNGGDASVTTASSNRPLVPTSANLADSLKRIGDYDPDRFRSMMHDLATLVGR